MPKIAIVNENDEIVGAADVDAARAAGLIHRIARIMVVNSANQLLLQRRSLLLQDNPGIWDYSVSGHVDEDETYEQAATREAAEELGLSHLELAFVIKFYGEKTRQAQHIKRFDTIFMAETDQPIRPNQDEVAETRWVGLDELARWLKTHPQDFTTGLRITHDILANRLRSYFRARNPG